MRNVMRYVLLAAYDRKINRVPFDGLLLLQLELDTLLSKMEASAFAGSLFQGLGHDPVRLKAALLDFNKDFIELRAKIRSAFWLVTQCPVAGDPIA